MGGAVEGRRELLARLREYFYFIARLTSAQ